MLFTLASQILQTSAQMLTHLAPLRTSGVLEGVEEQSLPIYGKLLLMEEILHRLALLKPYK